MTAPSRSGWPESLARIADVIGDAAALRLVSDFGGTRIYVPKTPSERGAVPRSIGLKAAQALAKAYGGNLLEIPNGAMLASKKLMIIRSEGNSRVTARAARSTQRYVRMVRHDAGITDERQPSLPLLGGKRSS